LANDPTPEPISERVPFKATSAVAGRIAAHGTPGYTQAYVDRGGVANVNASRGGGDAALLGAIPVVQSHCADAGVPITAGTRPFIGEVSTFTNADGKTITGEYRGQLVPTNTAFPPGMSAPHARIVEALVCISGGTASGNSVDHCAVSRFLPARGLMLFNAFNTPTGETNETTLSVHQAIGTGNTHEHD
jgi:hypothetical protein